MTQMVFKRTEVKYLLDPGQRSRFERLIANHLTGDEYGPSTVRNVYFDTPTLLLARRSEEHPVYKEKIRARCYGARAADDPVFLEIKKKYRGIVYKRRAELAPARAAELLRGYGRPQTQIEREIDFTVRRYEGLGPRVFLAYDREAFFSPEDESVRVTLDARVRARTDRLTLSGDDDGALLLAPGLSVLEVKCLEGMPLWLVRFLSEEGLRKTRVSKYGLACRALLADAVPQAVATARAAERAAAVAAGLTDAPGMTPGLSGMTTSPATPAAPNEPIHERARLAPRHLAKGGLYV